MALKSCSPHMHRSPIPALPAIRIPGNLCEASSFIHKQHMTTMAAGYSFPLTMPIAAAQHSVRPIRLLDPLNLVGYYSCSLIPGNPLILALTSVLRVPLSIRVPIDPLEWILNPVRRVGTFFIDELIRS